MAQRETQPCATVFARRLTFRLAEILKQIGEVVGTDPDAGVFDDDVHPAILNRHAERNSAVARKFSSIAQDVHDGLPKLRRIDIGGS